MLEDILEIKRINGNDVYFRRPDKQVKNKPTELEKIVKYLTNEDFEDYEGKKFKRHLINPEKIEILDTYPKLYDLFDSDDETDNYTCLFTKNTGKKCNGKCYD